MYFGSIEKLDTFVENVEMKEIMLCNNKKSNPLIKITGLFFL